MSIEIYPFPKGLPASELYRVFVNEEEIFVTDTQLCLNGIDYPSMIHAPVMASYASFGAKTCDEINVRVSVLFGENIKEAKILPASKEKPFELTERDICFKMKAGEKLCVYANEAENNMLMLFANDAGLCEGVDCNDENVIYFAPGVHEIKENENKIEIKSNQTLYLAGGAYVFGRVEANGAENIRIMGPGVLCGTRNKGSWPSKIRPLMGETDKTPRSCLAVISKCKGVTLDSPCFVDSPMWTVKFIDCEDVTVRNVKVLGCRPNSDGIDICSSRRVRISDCFLRNSDDGIVLKAPYGTGDVSDVVVEKCTIWADRASALEIGHEIVNSNVKNVVFKDIDILNCTEETIGYHALDITNVDNGEVSDILFENIRIERSARFIGIRIRESMFRSDASVGVGRVRNITFKNISTTGRDSIFIFGRDAEHKISDVSFENLTVSGKPLLSLDGVRHNTHVENICIKSSCGEVIATLEDYPRGDECTPVDILPMTNMTFGTDRGVYGMRDKDFMDLPKHYTVDGIPFMLAEQGYNRDGDGAYKRGVIPPNRIRSAVPAAMACDFGANMLFFLQTAVNVYSEIDTVIAKYVITYDDGSNEVIDVKNQNDCNDWRTWSLAGWNAAYKSLRLYVQVWKNPHPEKKVIKIEMRDSDLPEMCVLFAITRA